MESRSGCAVRSWAKAGSRHARTWLRPNRSRTTIARDVRDGAASAEERRVEVEQPQAYAVNILRFYVFRSLVSFFLWLPIWVIFFEERGLSLSRLGTLDAITRC